ncbi:PKD domain-containing protein [Pelagimonas phthalicica]|nr:RHS repeat-associated core domain-containing protein [Pelagimonas phthalicica]
MSTPFDGDVTASWSWEARPASSVADFSDPSTLFPKVTPDLPGTYAAKLQLLDQYGTALDTAIVRFGTENLPPIAKALARGVPGNQVSFELDGSESFDPNGDALTYTWSVAEAPYQANVVFTDSSAPLTGVTYDAEGFYVLILEVSDTSGEIDRTELKFFYEYEWTKGAVLRNLVPEPSARFDSLSGSVGQPVSIDPWRSADSDGTYLVADMKLLMSPAGANPSWSVDQNRLATLVPDVPGTYLAAVDVNDGRIYSRDYIAIIVDRAVNIAPVARIAPVSISATGAAVSLDGSQSFDLDGDLLSYSWSILSAPESAVTSLNSNNTPIVELQSDLSGDYVVQLAVSDGANRSYATLLIRVSDNLPLAVAGVDQNSGLSGMITVDGSAVAAINPTYHWSLTGLSGGTGLGATLTTDTLLPSAARISLSRGQMEFFDAVMLAPVFEPLRAGQQGACAFDFIQPDDLTSDPHSGTANLVFEGKGWDIYGENRQVWRIENQDVATHIVTLRSASGTSLAEQELPGQASVYLMTDNPGAGLVDLEVSGASVTSAPVNTGYFLRAENVCTDLIATTAQLIVEADNGVSKPDTLFIGDANLRPTLVRNENTPAANGGVLSLNGADYANDLDGDTLSYSWSLLRRPDTSSAALAEKVVVTDVLEFTPDVTGLYLIQLTAHDGELMAEPVVLAIDTSNTQPVAVASGPAQAFVGETVTFDGSASYDPDGDSLSFGWTIESQPAGSAATIADPFGPLAQFTPDRRGSYIFGLRVADYGLGSELALVTLDVPNRAPVAALEGPTAIDTLTNVTLSALASADPDNDPLTYSFAITTAPAGALVDITPNGGEAVFTTNTAGSYVVTVTVSDGDASSTAELAISAQARNSAPVLGDLLDVYTVELGLELALDLTATDADGDTLSFFANPLPLVDGAVLQANSGALRFRPEAGQEGSYAVTLGVSDGAQSDTAQIVINVVAAAAGDTALTGVVRDAVTGAVLPDVPLHLQTAALSTTSGPDGSFSFGSLQVGSDVIEALPTSGYLGLSQSVRVTENQIRDVDPDLLLTPLNDGCATVVAGVETVLTGTSSGVTVTIPAGSMTNAADGTAYTGQVCLGSLPQLFAHNALPDDVQACHIYALDAPGAQFGAPVTITAPNSDQLPQGAVADLWATGLGGEMSVIGSASVVAGGAAVQAELTMPGQGALISVLPKAPTLIASEDMPTGVQHLTPFNGDLAETYTLPGYRAFNRDQSVGLAYHSSAANPKALVGSIVTIASDAGLPVTVQTKIELQGLTYDDLPAWTPRESANGSVAAVIGEEVSLRQTATIDTIGLAQGRYPYGFVSQAMYACSTVSTRIDGEFYQRNAVESPYGRGWAVDGLQSLTVTPDGKVAIQDDDTVTTFDPAPTVTSFQPDPIVVETVGTMNTVIHDLNLDGLQDIAFAEGGTGEIKFMLNLGEGQFSDPVAIPVADTVEIPQTGTFTPKLLEVVAGQISEDGFADFAYGIQSPGTLAVLGGDGNGGFSELSSEVRSMRDLGIADMNDDGYPDIVVSSRTSLSAALTVSYGAADGEDRRGVRYGLGSARPGDSRDNTGLQVLLGDVDNDGLIDAGYRSEQGFRILFSSVSATNSTLRQGFPGPIYGDSGTNLLGNYAELMDANKDGLLDVVWSGTDRLDVFLNEGGRDFGAPISLARPASASAAGYVTVFDVDGDENDDIILSTTGSVAVYYGNGDGTFLPFEEGTVPETFVDADIADLNGDGSPDLVSAQRFSVTVRFSDVTGSQRFIAGAGEFSSLARLDDGGWERRYKDGSTVIFDAAGRQTETRDTQGNALVYSYDSDNRVTSITDQVGGVTLFTYDASSGRLATVTYPDGRLTTFAYDDLGNLANITDPTSATVSFAYDENGRLISTTNQNGHQSSYSYDAYGNMSGATLPDGSSIANQVAASLGLVDGLGGLNSEPLLYVAPEDRVTTVTDRKGQVTEIEVNKFGSTVRITDPLGRTTFIERDENNLAIRIDRPSEAAASGRRIDLLSYDAFGNVEAVTEAAGTPAERTKTYVYELEFNNVVSMTDGDGFTTSYEYDAFGEVTKITDPEGGERLMSYTAEGKLNTRTDENGNITAFTYGPDLNLETVTYADGSVSEMVYDASGNTTQIVEASGTALERQVHRTYDALNRVLTVEVTGADGAQIDGITQYSYLPAGNLATVTDETGLVTSMGYDALERLVQIDDPAEGLITREYNDAGEVIRHVNGDGEETAYAYDDVSRLTQVTDAEGFVKSFAYDTRDNITSVTDGRGGETIFAYDERDRMTVRTNPLGLSMSRAYDARDNLITLTREDGIIETAIYDGLGRRTQVVTPDNTLTYAFDAYGNLTEAADDDSRVTFEYDLRNRLSASITDGTVGPQPGVRIDYTYDLLDRRTSMTDSLGGVTSYAYDAEDRLTDLTAPWGTVYSFGYDGEGRRTSLTSTSGRDTRYGYTNGLLSSLSHMQSGVALTDLAYDYGPDGQLTEIRDQLDPSKSKTISYDHLNRLVQVAEGVPVIDGGVPIPVEDYAYDEEGNRTTSHLSTLYSSNDHNQLLEDDGFTYAYDDRGNRVSKTSKADGSVESYSYDSQNRLVGYASPTTTASYAYDALDRRIAKDVDGDMKSFVYDRTTNDKLAHDDIILEYNFTGEATLTRRWLHSIEIDEPVAFESYSAAGTGSERVLYANHQGSVILVSEPSSSSILAGYEYSGYGATRQTLGVLQQPYRFTGREYDSESGLYHYRARAFDPGQGIFLQRDPIGFASGTLNTYSYVNGDPFNYTDPSGLVISADNAVRTVAGVGMVLSALAILQPAWELINDASKALILEMQKSGANGSPDDYPGYGDNGYRDPDGSKCAAAIARVKAAKTRARKCKLTLTKPQNIINLYTMIELGAARAQRDSVCTNGPTGTATYGGEMEAHSNAWQGVGKCMIYISMQ